MFDHLLVSLSAISLPVIFVVYFVGVFTPGPNNAMLLLSGQRIGLRRTIPHGFGIAAGMVALITVQGIFFGELFQVFPWSYRILQLAFSAFLLWLAYKIATADVEAKAEADTNFPIPFGFWRAFLFQAINPKAWSIVGVIITNYGSGRHDTLAFESVIIAVSCFPLSLISCTLWTSFGVALRSWLSVPSRARIFYRLMAALLVVALVLGYTEDLSRLWQAYSGS